MEWALAIDIGGSKLAAGIVTRAGVLVTSAQQPTAAGSADELLARVVALAAEVRSRALRPEVGHDLASAPVAVGVGCGGPMARGGERVSPLNIEVWRDVPLREHLQEATGLATFVDNDAKALVLGERWCGAGRGQRNLLAMVVSTGVGGGIVLDGRLLDGVDGNAGHIGHVIVEPEGRRCACGARGCLEAEASGTAIAAITGRPAAEAGPEVVARTGRMVGRAVASVANLLDLDLACVAGSVALGFGAPFFAAAQAELDDRARLSFSRGARIVPAGLGADAPLVGAAAVGWRGLGVDLTDDAPGRRSTEDPTGSTG